MSGPRRRAGLIGGVVILALLGSVFGRAPFLDALDVIDGPSLAVALLLGVGTTFFSAWRWSLVAEALGIRLPLRRAVGDYYRALFLNAALPGGVLGDVHRAVRHGKDVDDVTLAAKAVVIERASGQIVLLGTGAAVLLVTAPVAADGVLAGVSPGVSPGVFTVVGVLAVLLLAGTAVRALVRRGTFPGVAHLRSWAQDTRRGLLSPRTGPRVLLASAVVLSGHLATFVVAARAAGSTVPLARLLPLLLLALVAMTLPLNVGGWGPREGALAGAFAAAGLSAAQGLTTAVVYGVFALVASLPGAGFLAVGELVDQPGSGPNR